MNEHDEQDKATPPLPETGTRRRSLLQALTLGAGAATFFGPWKVHHAWAQAAQKKPLVIGLTMDASGQYAASGMDERLGAMMAIKEFNAKGGVLGRPIEAIHMDSETTPATGSRVAERLITRNDVAYLVGALHSGVTDQDASHDLCARSEEMTSPLPRDTIELHKLQIRLVHEVSRAQRMIAAFPTELAFGNSVQVVVDRRQHPVQRRVIATCKVEQCLGHVGVWRHVAPQDARKFAGIFAPVQGTRQQSA